MPLEITVGPAQLALHHGFTILVTEPDGSIGFPSDKGLYFNDTRIVSAYAVRANGQAWTLLNGGATGPGTCRVYLTNEAVLSEAGEIPARSLSFVLRRAVAGGLAERHEITNHGRSAVVFNHEVVIRSDFADVFEVKSKRIVRRGRITAGWDEATGTGQTNYRNGAFMRGLRVTAGADGSAPVHANGRLSFAVHLAPGQTWRASLRFALLDGDAVHEAPPDAAFDAGVDAGFDGTAGGWEEGVLRLTTSVPGVQDLFDQAMADIAALRLPIPLGKSVVTVPAAGLPWFVALFGRDTLITSLQCLMLDPDIARGTLAVLAAWQATVRDDFRDAEPGKILHELRQGELAFLKLIPHTPYYGTADATPLYLMLLHATWLATGDIELLRTHADTASRCLAWIDDYGDRDGDGFQEYGTRSGQGYENVGWKDSGDAVVDEAGGQVQGPKALCELQGYVYAAWRGMAQAFTALGDPDRARALDAKADALFDRFNAVFWNEAEGFYAYCLDGAKRPVGSVASNPGHLLWCGLVPPERAARMVARFQKADLWSGWGIRTLSASNPAYNPYSYQNGSVWPHDNSLIALGFARYGFGAEAARVFADVHAASGFFAQRQMPELYSGVQRQGSSFPVQYLGANVPQAWAAGSVFAFLQAVLGLSFDAPNGAVTVRPALPEWLPDVTLHGLRVGPHRLDIAFRGTEFQVLSGDAAVVRRA